LYNLYIEAAKLKELWRNCLKKWLIGLIAGVLKNDPAQYALILTGARGAGKTTWLRNLCPPELQKKYYFEGHLIPRANNKETIDLLTEKLVVNFDDQLDQVSHRDFGSLKSIISSMRLTARKSYAINNATRFRICGFIGSINETEFLSEDKNRRYLVFTVLHIKEHPGINMKQVYAQACHLWEKGQKHNLDLNEQTAINQMNQRYRSISLEEELIMLYFQPISADSTNKGWHSTTEILIYLQNQTGHKAIDRRRLGSALKVLGFEQKSIRDGQNTPKKWGLERIKGPEIL
jgi:predicted P-loop ATPase